MSYHFTLFKAFSKAHHIGHGHGTSNRTTLPNFTLEMSIVFEHLLRKLLRLQSITAARLRIFVDNLPNMSIFQCSFKKGALEKELVA